MPAAVQTATAAARPYSMSSGWAAIDQGALPVVGHGGRRHGAESAAQAATAVVVARAALQRGSDLSGHRGHRRLAVVSAVDLLIAAGVAFLAGGINSVAGGGSLILFPTLVALGLGTVAANVTNSVAQWPGYLGGVAGFRKRVRRASAAGSSGSALVARPRRDGGQRPAADHPVGGVRRRRPGAGAAGQPAARRPAADDQSAPAHRGRRRPPRPRVAVRRPVPRHRLRRLLRRRARRDPRRRPRHRAAPAEAGQRAEVGALGRHGHDHAWSSSPSSAPVDWLVVAVAAPASLVGGFLGARIATRIPATPLRILIVGFGVAVSIYLFLRI